MKIGIIGAMDEEIRLLKEKIQTTYQENHHGNEFMIGKIGKHDVVLIRSGIGKVNATISTVLLKQLYDVDYIINTGSAGGIAEGLKVGDIVIADSLVHHDVDVTAFGYQVGQMAGMPAEYNGDTNRRTQIESICCSLQLPYHVGQIVSGDEFINSSQRIERIRTHFPLALACEMESAAIAQTAYVLGVPFNIIRAISDSADDEASLTFDEFILLAGQKSAQLVVDFIQSIQ